MLLWSSSLVKRRVTWIAHWLTTPSAVAERGVRRASEARYQVTFLNNFCGWEDTTPARHAAIDTKMGDVIAALRCGNYRRAGREADALLALLPARPADRVPLHL